MRLQVHLLGLGWLWTRLATSGPTTPSPSALTVCDGQRDGAVLHPHLVAGNAGVVARRVYGDVLQKEALA